MTAGPAFGPEWSAGLRRGSDAELRGWLAVAIAACDEADVVAREHFRRDLEIETKPDRTFVTQADKAIERMIRERLLDAFPDHGLVGEEYGTEAGDRRTRRSPTTSAPGRSRTTAPALVAPTTTRRRSRSAARR